MTGSRVMEIRDYLDEDYERRGYMNLTHMKVALDNTVGIRYWTIGPRRPKLGLVFIGWGGHEAKPVKVQYRFTHWLGVEGDKVFEVNAPELVTWEEWQRVMPRLIQEEGKGNGTFHIRQGIEVRLRYLGALMPRLKAKPQISVTRMELAQRLQFARKSVGLSQGIVAAQIGMTQAQLCDIEHARCRIYADQLILLARIYGRPLDWFVAPVMAWEGTLYA